MVHISVNVRLSSWRISQCRTGKHPIPLDRDDRPCKLTLLDQKRYVTRPIHDTGCSPILLLTARFSPWFLSSITGQNCGSILPVIVVDEKFEDIRSAFSSSASAVPLSHFMITQSRGARDSVSSLARSSYTMSLPRYAASSYGL